MLKSQPRTAVSVVSNVPGDLPALISSWRRALVAQDRSPRTIKVYLLAVNELARFLAERGMPTSAASIAREHIEEWLTAQIDRAPATRRVRLMAVKSFFAWLLEEDEVSSNPTTRIRPPAVPEAPPPVLTDEQLRRLLKACEGSDLEARRDAALMRLLIDTGCRVSEVAGLNLTDLDLDQRVIHVLGKGRRARTVPFGRKTAQALDRYLRKRGQHADSTLPNLWLGRKGPLTAQGIRMMVHRRARTAGLGRVYPHLMRHGFAHTWLANGGQESDLMRLAGWRSAGMLRRYGAAAADERARMAYQTRSPVDRL